MKTTNQSMAGAGRISRPGRWLVPLLSVVLAAGCSDTAGTARTQRPDDQDRVASSASAPPPPPPVYTPADPPSAPPVADPPDEAPPPAVTNPDEAGETSSPVPTERVVAEPGVGIKGRSLDDLEGVLVTPAKEFFSFREKAVFQIQIPGAMRLFKASEGRAPASDEEFMQKIIKQNQIVLPQLPSGHRYVYDPQQEQLMVERPRRD